MYLPLVVNLKGQGWFILLSSRIVFVNLIQASNEINNVKRGKKIIKTLFPFKTCLK